MRAFAEKLYDHRWLAAGVFLIISLLFGWKLHNLEIATHFSDLYPANHPYVKLFKKYPNFGSPFTVDFVIKVKHGTIYNPDTLKKIQSITRQFDLIPGIDHDGIVSIASRKVKHVEATVSGVSSSYLLMGPIPQTPKQLADFRHKVHTTVGVVGTLVSSKEDAALIQASFIERLIDYNVVWTSVNRMIKQVSDKNTEAFAAGQPMLTGWVYHYEHEMYVIFGIGFFVMIGLLLFYFRNFHGVLVPSIVGLISGLWGFGFAGLLGYNLDPLIIVVPILLVARALSHSVQMCERFFELYYEKHDVRESSIEALVSLFQPGCIGILCDAAGIFLIAIAPIRLIQKLAYVCGLWSLSLVFTAIILTFVLLSLMPGPRNVDHIVLSAEKERTILFRVFEFISIFSSNQRRSAMTCGGFLLIAIVSAFLAHARIMGDPHAGTSLLWPESPYNLAVKEINTDFRGFDTLQVVAEGGGALGIRTADRLMLIRRFERYMERDPIVGGAFSFADFVPPVNRLFQGGLPKWQMVPPVDTDAAMTSQLAMGGAGPRDFDRWITYNFDSGAISVWYKNHRSSTIVRALTRAQAFIHGNREALKHAGLKLRMAAGTIGLLAAIDQVIGHLEIVTVLLISCVIFIITSLVYRSVTAGLLLVLVSNLAYLLTCAIMYLKGIGLNVDTFPVAAVGMGIGIDYNIYLMSRMCEEYVVNSDYARLVPSSIFTTGKAIFFTATTMVSGVAIWYFLSDLRFQAEMGLLLASVMVAHVIMALFFQAAMMQLLRPRFISERFAEREGREPMTVSGRG